jgi:DNA gyrase/topoisomerase IV subunit B
LVAFARLSPLSIVLRNSRTGSECQIAYILTIDLISIARPFGWRPSYTQADKTSLSGTPSLLDAILAADGKGVSQQRYKGLGEVNLPRHWKREGRPQRALAASAA